MTPGLARLTWSGVFQLKRNRGSPSRGDGLMSLLSSVERRTRNRLPPWYSSKIVSASVGSGNAQKPSPPVSDCQCLLPIPPARRDGPYQLLLSCRPPYTLYGHAMS